MANQRVFSPASPGTPEIILVSSAASSSVGLYANLLSTPQCISDLLSKFPDVLPYYGFTASPPCQQIHHQLLTRPGLPVFAKPCLLNPKKLASVMAKFSAMEKAGIVHGSMSPWSSLLHIDWRLCGDYGRLNTDTVSDRYPLPNIADFMFRILGSIVFSKLYLQKVYYLLASGMLGIHSDKCWILSSVSFLYVLSKYMIS